MSFQPIMVDPEVAALAFRRDLDQFWAEGRPEELGWRRRTVDSLTELIEVVGVTPDGASHAHLVKLNASYYPMHPPQVLFVVPGELTEAPEGSIWFPMADPGGDPGRPQWFGLHANYGYPGEIQRQLICYSHNLDYYLSDHNPQDSEVWKPGVHTVAATLNRLAEILAPVYYRGPASVPQAA
jgi:hypothetical protein